jgi:hypothetical protein
MADAGGDDNDEVDAFAGKSIATCAAPDSSCLDRLPVKADNFLNCMHR